MPASSILECSDSTVDPHIRGFLHVPETPNQDGLVLTHGAGGNAQAPLLIVLAEAFAATGVTVLRCNLPYRQARPFGPPGPGDAGRDRAGLKNAIAKLRAMMSGRIFLGGHSYGGRQSSMLCAEEPDLAAALLLLSYPLHPPRRPEQQRTQHLPDLRTPALFVSGTRDPFGSIEELQRAIKMIPAKTKLLPVDGAGHDLGFKGRSKKEELPKQIVSEFTDFFAAS
ncbi:MAG TPA: alpha/beta family hydrolase [Candidatus Binatia bacterium]|nr:alpha/beta family hydrolase [Candidatus Binatia bacterium]